MSLEKIKAFQKKQNKCFDENKYPVCMDGISWHDFRVIKTGWDQGDDYTWLECICPDCGIKARYGYYVDLTNTTDPFCVPIYKNDKAIGYSYASKKEMENLKK